VMSEHGFSYILIIHIYAYISGLAL
jgi:hypothetical protein